MGTVCPKNCLFAEECAFAVGDVPPDDCDLKEDEPTMPDEISREQAIAACDLLAAYGRQHTRVPADRGRGWAIGKAVAACNDAPSCIIAATEMLEQWNCHLMVAAIWAIWKGRKGLGHRGNPPHGSITREGRFLHIRLPDHWTGGGWG